MRAKHFALFTILLFTLMGCAEKEIVLTQEHLRGATLENFVVSEESPNQVQCIFEEKVLGISNLVTQGINENGDKYFLLETDTANKQLLVVLNEPIDKLQWGEYYAEKTENVVVTQKDLETATLENFVLIEELSNQLFYVFDETFFAIKNLLVQEVNKSGVMYFFLEADTEKEQLLVVLNEDLNKVQWAEYYTEYAYFNPKYLVAFVVEPLPERYQEATVKTYDFRNQIFGTNILDFIMPSGHSIGDQQFYYLTPIYAERDEWGDYDINWQQAHYTFRDYFYGTGHSTFGYTLGRTSLDQLEPLLSTVTEWTIPTGYNAIAGNTSENFDVVFIAPEGEVANWENCEIFYYNKETEETMQVLFASIFRYQDELLGITPAQNRDERAAFIVETKEFTYDFYFDPAGLTTDAFLRPGSYRLIGGI